MSSFAKWLLTLGVVVFGANLVNAQGQYGFFGQPAMLLRNEGVQKEIKLSEDQTQKVKDLAGEMREKYKDEFGSLQGLDEKERGEKMSALLKKVNEEVMSSLAKVLQPDQTKRLKEISLQQRGPQAFTDEEVSKTLQLTEEQKTKVKTVLDDAGKKMKELVQEGVGGDREERVKKFTELRNDTTEKGMAVLNDKQKKAWKHLTGEPFEVKWQPRGN